MASSSKKKDGIDELLSQEVSQGPLVRGTGYHLSTDAMVQQVEAQTHLRTIAQVQPADQPTEEKKKDGPKRVNRGYKLREDLIKRCKRLALEEDRTLYEVMEEALEQYLEQKSTGDESHHS